MQTFLKEFGYLSEGLSARAVSDALRQYRHASGLPERDDNWIDRRLIERMRQPRCGNPDRDDELDNSVSARRRKRFGNTCIWGVTYNAHYSTNVLVA